MLQGITSAPRRKQFCLGRLGLFQNRVVYPINATDEQIANTYMLVCRDKEIVKGTGLEE